MKKKNIPGLVGLFAASLTGLSGCILEPVKVYGPPPAEIRQEQEAPTTPSYNPKDDIDKMVCVYGPPPFEQEEVEPIEDISEAIPEEPCTEAPEPSDAQVSEPSAKENQP